ncbi:uncharacterized protein LOC104429282 [Eucalyptus grandis]|uniref:uncharacterized protein LOC104429282 n=1 Tax=Eucalyptus grandis TaxID=71139 RepID=UPI00192EF05C|nr:uncharacterized protein LOC104429282 [Eucalyptus grandis]
MTLKACALSLLPSLNRVEIPTLANQSAASLPPLSVKSLTEVMADYTEGTSWDDNDPSVFEMNTVGGLQVEYQITIGYGPSTAGKLLQEIWSEEKNHETLATEDATSSRRSPPCRTIARERCSSTFASLTPSFQPFANPRAVSQPGGRPHNREQESGFSSGFKARFEDGTEAKMAADRQIAVTNGDGCGGGSGRKYGMKLGCEAVRYAPNAYLILSNRLGPAQELLQFVGGLSGVVIDMHYYNLCDPKFKQWNLRQNIDYIYNNRASALSKLTTASGPLCFVGEWTLALDFNGATKEDSGRFAKA